MRKTILIEWCFCPKADPSVSAAGLLILTGANCGRPKKEDTV
ncbi:hypothetical protein [Caproicibacterium amylolyticum]|nr:hypothetical protein [Caproicibacterium amylolyticum]